MATIKIRCIGEDYWSRLTFQGDNGKFYKILDCSSEEEFENLSREEQIQMLETLSTSVPINDPQGEPGYICWNPQKFVLIKDSACTPVHR